jgi:alpha-tubulin suppressor-like RCC1 family protein
MTGSAYLLVETLHWRSKSNGTLWAWGRNDKGQLGDGSSVNSNVPVQVGTANDWASISAGNEHSIALKSNGTIWSWGDNSSGQLGDGTVVASNIPVQTGSGRNWVSIAAGGGFSLALQDNGTLWAWGDNTYGQLGDGSTTQRTSPVQAGTDNNWTCISAGGAHSLMLKADGSLWACGSNASGQLGDGTTTDRSTAVQIGTEKRWIAVNAAMLHSHALRSEGSLRSWGDNNSGQLADGTTIQRNSPVQSGSGNDWVKIAGGSDHILAIKAARNQFCASGNNNAGQLGDNTNSNKSDFVCVCSSTPATPQAYDRTSCTGGPATLYASGEGNMSWYSAATGGQFLAKGSKFITPVLTADSTFYVQDSTCFASPSRTAVRALVRPLPDLSTGRDESRVYSNQGGASYKWIDCNDLFKPITGATSYVYDPPFNGSYAVIIDFNGCIDTTACVSVDNVGIEEEAGQTLFSAYPNPGSGTFTVQAKAEGKFTIISELGQTIKTFELNAANNYSLEIEISKNGIYFITGFSNNMLIRKKIVITK